MNKFNTVIITIAFGLVAFTASAQESALEEKTIEASVAQTIGAQADVCNSKLAAQELRLAQQANNEEKLSWIRSGACWQLRKSITPMATVELDDGIQRHTARVNLRRMTIYTVNQDNVNTSD